MDLPISDIRKELKVTGGGNICISVAKGSAWNGVRMWTT